MKNAVSSERRVAWSCIEPAAAFAQRVKVVGETLTALHANRSADPYADLAMIAPYAMNVQVKVSMHPEGGKRQPADMRRLAQILTDSGYRGYIVLEYEEPGDPRTECPRYVAEMRRAFLG